MKLLPVPVVGLMAFVMLAVAVCAESTQQMLTAAQAAYLRGDLETAKKGFAEINRIDPRNTTVIGYLKMIAAQEAKNPPVATQQKQLEKLIVPKIEFREATLGSTLDFLKQAAKKHSNDKIAVNFVVQLPDEQIKTQAITLSLSEVPFTEALRYLGDVANIDFAYEKYAIRVKPRSASTGPAAANTVPANP